MSSAADLATLLLKALSDRDQMPQCD